MPSRKQCPIRGNQSPESFDHLSKLTDTAVNSSVSLSILHGTVRTRLCARVLARLAEAEFREPDAWLRDDYRIAWLTVLHCDEGHPDPWRYAFWKYLGQTPEKLIPFFIERAEKHRLLDVPDYDPTTNKLPASPTKLEPRLYRDCRKGTA